MPQARRAVAPGRVNLIGDHTDYNRGLALPMAVGLAVTVTFAPTDDPTLVATSSSFDKRAVFPLGTDPALLEPSWARLVAAVASVARIRTGGTLAIESTLPVGSGLSSSAALAVAVATVLGVSGTPETMARLCQGAEHRIGVPVGLMDPLVCAGGRAGHAMLIDFDAVADDGGGGGGGDDGGDDGGGDDGGDTVTSRHIPIPEEAEFVVVDSGQRRTLSTSAYAERVAECRAAARVVGPLGRSTLDDVAALSDPVLRRRARHVVTECTRVRDTATALAADDLAGAGALLTAGHRSLADDFAVSTPVVDDLVAALVSRRGVFGARMTGAGFGGCVVALTRPGAVDTSEWPTPAWRVQASNGTLARPT